MTTNASSRAAASRTFAFAALGKRFLIFQCSGFLLMLAAEVERLSVAWWCLGRTHSTSLFASMVTMGTLAYLAAQPLLGWLGDRYPRRNVIAVSCAVNASAGFVLFLLSTLPGFNPTAVALTLLVGSLASSTVPALLSSTLPTLLPSNRIQDGVRLRMTLVSTASIMGPLVGGLVVTAFGYAPALGIDFVLVAGAALAFFFAVPRSPQGAAEKGGPKSGATLLRQWWRMTRFGAIAVWTVAPERELGLLAMVTNAAMFPFFSIVLPVLVKETMGDPAWVAGAAATSVGVGMFLGSTFVVPFLSARFNADRRVVIGRNMIALAILLTGVAVYFLQLHFAKIVCMGALFTFISLSGMGSSVVNISTSSARVRAIPNSARTRIFAATGFLSGIGIPIGNAVQGMTLSFAGPGVAAGIVAGVMLLAACLYVSRKPVRELLSLPDAEVDGAYSRLYPAVFAED